MAAIPGARASERARRPRLFERWLQRRTRLDLPLTLAYRQIFILPTRFGWLLAILMGAMLIGSLNFNNNLGLLTTFIVAATSINTMLLSFRTLRGLVIRRGGAVPVHAGQAIDYRLAVDNPVERPRSGLVLRAGDARNVFSVAPRGSREVRLRLTPRARGWHKPGRLRIETTHPLGLFCAWSWFEPRAPVLVWPAPAADPPSLPEQGEAQLGGRRSPREEGEEFHSLRRWREGDPLHRIAWKASQRHQTLLSREFRRERSRHVTLDLSLAPGRDLEERIRILTAWVLRADADGREWTLKAGERALGPARGEAHRHACLRALAET
ncbi:MAG: DUF58 domain-containing protein [Gammaproteobacteria bacterium]|jgi:uncharacterized protein (DUF58 family)|nr:DUF58 domain-containing protein [Gammaproteobacteria bacterium]